MCWLSLGHSHPQQHDDDRVHSIHQGDDDDDSIIITIIGAYGKHTHTRTHHSRRRFTILTWLARTRSTLTHSITLSTHYFWSKQSQTMEKERTEREEEGRRKIFFLPSLLWPLELTAAAVVVVVVAAAAAALVAESMFPHFRPTTIRPFPTKRKERESLDRVLDRHHCRRRRLRGCPGLAAVAVERETALREDPPGEALLVLCFRCSLCVFPNALA